MENQQHVGQAPKSLRPSMQQEPVQLTELEALESRASEISNMVMSAVERVKKMRDRLKGPHPESVGTKPDPQPVGVLGKLQAQAEYAHQGVNAIHELLNELERIA